MAKIKRTIHGEDTEFYIIDSYIKDIPEMSRSRFMIDSSLQIIANSESVSSVTKKRIIPHLAELSNLINEMRDSELKTNIKKEVHALWLCLK